MLTAIWLARSRAQGIVLLKNDKRTLPLESEFTKSIAVIGPNADDASSMLGDYAPRHIYQNIVTVLDGIKGQVGPKTKVLYVKGCDAASGGIDEIEAAKAGGRQRRSRHRRGGRAGPGRRGKPRCGQPRSAGPAGAIDPGRSEHRDAYGCSADQWAAALDPLDRRECARNPRSLAAGRRGRKRDRRCAVRRLQSQRPSADHHPAPRGAVARVL